MDYIKDIREECRFVKNALSSINIQPKKFPLDVFTGIPCVDPKTIQEGHELCIMSDHPSESYVKVKVTHIYKRWIFYECLEGCFKGVEHFLSSRSQYFKEFVFPCAIVIPQGCDNMVILPTEKIKILENYEG